MPRAYSLDLRERLIDAVEAGSSARAAARRLQVSASTAVKWVQRKRETGSVEAKPMHGHPPAKLLPYKDRLLRLVAEEPDLTLKQIGERLAADGPPVSKSCLHTFLWRNRIRLKKRPPTLQNRTVPTSRSVVRHGGASSLGSTRIGWFFWTKLASLRR